MMPLCLKREEKIMNKKANLNRIKELYNNGENIIRHLRDNNPTSIEDIMISYDFQAGTYSDMYYKNPNITISICDIFLEYIKSLDKVDTIFEAGVGEANKLVSIVNKFPSKLTWVGGADLSWSRVKVAQLFAEKNLSNCQACVNLFMGDMMELPLLSNSIDLVYTSYALEPNGGKERELLRELYRVTRRWLVLLEPSYELANDAQKKRMDYHGYIKGLKETAEELGYNVIRYERFPVDENSDNPSAIMIIKKDSIEEKIDNPICCPITKTPVKQLGNVYYSDESMLAYPIINGVACLTSENAVVATKMEKLCK